MNSANSQLSEICRTAFVIDLDDESVWRYADLDIQKTEFNRVGSLSATSRAYLIYWPGGLATYLVERLDICHIQPSHIEAAHRAAKQLKAFTPFHWGRRK